jgi:hypothetical protein
MERLKVPYPEIPEGTPFLDAAANIIAGESDDLFHLFTGKKRV